MVSHLPHFYYMLSLWCGLLATLCASKPFELCVRFRKLSDGSLHLDL